MALRSKQATEKAAVAEDVHGGYRSWMAGEERPGPSAQADRLSGLPRLWWTVEDLRTVQRGQGVTGAAGVDHDHVASYTLSQSSDPAVVRQVRPVGYQHWIIVGPDIPETALSPDLLPRRGEQDTARLASVVDTPERHSVVLVRPPVSADERAGDLASG